MTETMISERRAATRPPEQVDPPLPLSARLMRAYLRSTLRGRTRLAHYAGVFWKPLQHVPLAIAEGQAVYLDMRDNMCREILRNFPFQFGIWEPDEQAVMRRLVRAGDIVFDIGAHFGEHSTLLARLVGRGGRVYVFEANPERIDNLRRTVAPFGNAEVLPFAVSSEAGTATLYVPELHVTASLADWTGGQCGPTRQIKCEQVTIDGLFDQGRVPHPDFVKCDIEGAELKAFHGAINMLNRPDAPMVMYEANGQGAEAFGCSISASTDFLKQLAAPAFSFYWVQPEGTLVPVTELRSDVRLFNLVAVPASRRDRLEG